MSEKIVLQMAVKIVNNIADSDNLVPNLLVFGAYPHMHNMDALTPNIIQRAAAIDKTMNQVRKIRAKHQIADALNIRNGFLMDLIHDLLFNFDVVVW